MEKNSHRVTPLTTENQDNHYLQFTNLHYTAFWLWWRHIQWMLPVNFSTQRNITYNWIHSWYFQRKSFQWIRVGIITKSCLNKITTNQPSSYLFNFNANINIARITRSSKNIQLLNIKHIFPLKAIYSFSY